MTDAGSDPAETYRTADLRLRQLLLGDGVDTPGLVKGEDSRQRVINNLRRMRDAFNATVLEGQRVAVGKAQTTRVAELEEELRMIVSARSRTQHQTLSESETSALMTPAEAAQTLRVSKSSIYRAVRNGEIRAVRLTQKRGALRIPTSELQRLSAAR
jgi:excisionase family DNA binding protein